MKTCYMLSLIHIYVFFALFPFREGALEQFVDSVANHEVIGLSLIHIYDVKNVKVRNLRVTNGKIAAVLDECLKNRGLAYVVKDGAIAIRPANEVNAVKAVEQANVISGTVVDETCLLYTSRCV